jgi:hypothetical protein
MKHKNHCKALWLLPTMVVFFILAGAPHVRADEAEAKPITSDIKEANKELGIMARVLEASLDQSGLAPWQPVTPGISAFDARISVEYVPSVCAIFTIPVNFPILDPAKRLEQKEAPEQQKPDDLWEQYAREGDKQRDIWAQEPFYGMAMIDGQKRALPIVALNDETKRKERLKQADEQKERLRGVLLETLARYGHRLKHLNTKEEKIVFIVQAQSAPSDLSPSRLPGQAEYNLLLAQRLSTTQQIVLAGKPLGQVNYYMLVISNAKLNAAMAVEDLTSSAGIKEYYY